MGTKAMKLISATGGTACVLFLLYFFCLRSDEQDPHAHIREIAADLQGRTLRPGAQQLGPLNTETVKWSIKAIWDIETSQQWEDYCQWVSEQFILDFKARRVDDSKLLLVKHLPGDTYRVTLERIGSKPLRVRVTFLGYPS
jgi:hypothetical protein